MDCSSPLNTGCNKYFYFLLLFTEINRDILDEYESRYSDKQGVGFSHSDIDDIKRQFLEDSIALHAEETQRSFDDEEDDSQHSKKRYILHLIRNE